MMIRRRRPVDGLSTPAEESTADGGGEGDTGPRGSGVNEIWSLDEAVQAVRRHIPVGGIEERKLFQLLPLAARNTIRKKHGDLLSFLHMNPQLFTQTTVDVEGADGVAHKAMRWHNVRVS